MRADAELLKRLRAGEEEAFRLLVTEHHGALTRFARSFVANSATAEEVVQETWLAVLKGLDRFGGRSSLKTWMYSILANRARTRAVRNGRTILFGDMAAAAGEVETAVDPSRFKASGYWEKPPRPWDDFSPERLAESEEIRQHFQLCLEKLHAAQRAVILLRDVEGCSAKEACNILDLSETNQRVLLHRGRANLRRLLAPLMEKRGG